MRQTLLVLSLALFTAALGVSEKRPKTRLTVHAVTHDSRVSQYNSTYTTPGTASTNCSGSATTIGSTTMGNANCQTVGTPAQVHQTTRYTVDVANVVEADGSRYTITCRANWIGSNCAPMTDGDEFPAEIDGETMWVSGHRGGNQGKEVRTKYKIIDIRATPAIAPVPVVTSFNTKTSGVQLRNADVLALKEAGLSDSLIIEKIRSSATAFDLDTADLIALKKAGLADSVTTAMLEASRR